MIVKCKVCGAEYKLQEKFFFVWQFDYCSIECCKKAVLGLETKTVPTPKLQEK